MKPIWLIAIALFNTTPATAQQAPHYVYTARTAVTATQQGQVRAGALTWQCQGDACTISGPWVLPIPAACAQLARQVGRILSYGREGRMLGAVGLATCNAGLPAVAGAVPPIARAQPNIIAQSPVLTAPPARAARLAIAVPEMNLIVADPVPVSSNHLEIRSSELSLIVGAAVPTGNATIPITSSELSLIVR